MRRVLVLSIGLLLVGCGIPVSVQSFHEGPPLKGVHTVYVETGSVSLSRSGTAVVSVSTTVNVNSTVAAPQGDAEILKKNVAFSLREHGLKTTEEKQTADAVAVFSVGAITDEDQEWVAEKMFLEFQDPKTNAPICVFKADDGDYETVEDLLKAICKRISQEFL